jgi:hypothetical protein
MRAEGHSLQYGGHSFRVASRFLQQVVPGAATGQAPERVPLLAGAWASAMLLAELPKLRLTLTAGPAGRRLDAYFSHRMWGIRHSCLAQGVLVLPAEPGRYARGRSRQAVRTNMRKAQAAGVVCRPLETAGQRRLSWQLLGRCVSETSADEFALPGDMWWGAFAEDARPVAMAHATVDREVALLQSFFSLDRPSRYLLHTALVEALVAADVRYVVASGPMAPLLEPSLQYWQRLLGYQVANLAVRSEARAHRAVRLARASDQPAPSTCGEIAA